MNNNPGTTTNRRRYTAHPSPPSLPSIRLLFQMADSPYELTPNHHLLTPTNNSSLTLPPIRLRQNLNLNNNFFTDSTPPDSLTPSSSSSGSSSDDYNFTRTSSSPQPFDFISNHNHNHNVNINNKPTPTKRKQVKRACLNCQKACKGCADTRPCPRCVIHGLTESCVDAPRKSDRKIKPHLTQQ